MSDDPYLDPNSQVLRNKLAIRNPTYLDYVEREFVTQRLSEGCPTGDFDLTHLRAIHRHLFQDIYAWAGEVRTVEIAKDGSQFQPRSFIETGMADIHNRLKAASYLQDLTRQDFAAQAGQILGDVNYVHPFREGNGRTQAEYLRQLGERAGYVVDLAGIEGERWLAASKTAHLGDYALMAAEILRVIRP